MQVPCSWAGLPFLTAFLPLCYSVHLYTGACSCVKTFAVCGQLQSLFACPPLLH